MEWMGAVVLFQTGCRQCVRAVFGRRRDERVHCAEADEGDAEQVRYRRPLHLEEHHEQHWRSVRDHWASVESARHNVRATAHSRATLQLLLVNAARARQSVSRIRTVADARGPAIGTADAGPTRAGPPHASRDRFAHALPAGVRDRTQGDVDRQTEA